MSTTQPGVLDGVRIVEFAQNAAIPHCGRLLAGLGADVIKVEPPAGDAMRMIAPVTDRESMAFAMINPGKRSIVVDLTKPNSHAVIDALFAWAEVALVAFKPPDLVRYGIDWDHARAINPSLIHLTHTSLGPDGPDADQGGYDVLVQGRSGLGWMMNRSGGTGEAPQPTRPAVNDFGTGFVASFAVMAALRHRDQTGEGQRIDTSLLGTAMSLATPTSVSFERQADSIGELDEELAALRLAGSSFDDQRTHYEQRVIPAAGAFRLYFRHYQTSDGLISVAGMSPGLFAKLHKATGIDPPPTKDANAPEFQATVQAMEDRFASRTSAEWLADLKLAGYPSGPYNMPHEAVVDPQVIANDYVVELNHPDIGRYVTSAMPFQMEKSRAEVRDTSPKFGAHTRQVMEEVGLPADTIAMLIDDETLIDESTRES